MFKTIRAKVVTAIITVLAVSIAASIIISVRNQRTNLLEAKQQDLASNANVVNTSVRNVMLAGEAPIAVGLLEDLGNTPGFETLEVYRRDGTIAFSDFSTLEEVNDYQDFMTFRETERLPEKSLMTEAFRGVTERHTPRVVENLEAEQLEYYFPILNYSECQECHGTDHFVRGVAYYKVSLASVFDRIEGARDTLVLFYLGSGLVIALLLIQLMQRIVVRPIRQIGDVVGLVGEGNLEVTADVRGSSEFTTLSEKINAMIDGLKERNRLEVANSVIEARDQENRKYLDNIAEGLLLVNRDHSISEQYSRYLASLFGTNDIPGRTLEEFVYTPAEEAERKELYDFLEMIFENTSTEMEMIMSINPLAEKTLLVPRDEESQEIVVDTYFQRVFNDLGEVESVMVIFEDKTDIVQVQEELESERERYKSDIEHIATLLRSGPETYQDFEQDALATIDSLKSALKQKPDTASLEALNRDLHSLKGTARYLDFARVAEIAHQLEELFGELASGEEEWTQAARRRVEELTEQMNREMENMREINERFKSFARAVAPGEVGTRQLEDFIQQIERMARELAGELEKEIEVYAKNELNTLPHLSKLRNPVIHLVRNAVDHGLEDQFDRISKGKPNSGRLTLTFREDEGSYQIGIVDDGRGIDFEAVRKRGVERGLLEEGREYSENELLKVLFKPSFSTRSGATEISGRGVGLDVVQAEVRNLGGKISVGTKPGKGSRFTITIPKEGNNEE